MHASSATRLLPAAVLGLLAISLAGCGGGDPDPSADTLNAESTQATDQRMTVLAAAASISTSQRIAAATATAQSSTNDCAAARPFYWEIGSRDGLLAAGSVGTGVTARTVMPYASASKWLYGAYVVQRQKGVLTSTDVQMLTFRSGYTSFKSCEPGQTVDSCLATGTNGYYTASTDGRFYYGGGHMQKHASLIGLGAMSKSALTSAMSAQLGSDVVVSYSQPQLAGGGFGSAETYARFLRKVLSGQLRMGSFLGTHSVCTNPLTCGTAEAMFAPVPPNESWRYSLGHWVESDPVVGDGAFSSLGAFGFYPWIDASRTSYGVIARAAQSGARGSALCGRLVRKAWASGVAQQASTTAAAPPVRVRRR